MKQQGSRKQPSLWTRALEEWDMLVLLVLALGGAIATQFNVISINTLITLSLILLCALAINQMRGGVRVEKVATELHDENLQAMQEAVSLVDKGLGQFTVPQQQLMKAVDHVEGLLTKQHPDEAELVDQRMFYVRLIAALESAQRTVDLTQLDAVPPAQYGIPEKERYFNLSTEMVNTRPQIRFRRIVAIPNTEKLEWVLGVLEEVKALPNYNMHYVDISSERFFMPPLSLQIVDSRELCVVDPTRGFLTVAGQDRSLWIKSQSVAQVFSEYYEKFWSLTVPIKEGGVIYYDVLKRIEEQISSRRI